MYIFRYAGDITHLASLRLLLFKIHTIKSCADFISLYNTVMKLLYFGNSFSIVWYIRKHKIVRGSYDKEQDTVRHYSLVLPCLLLALLINEEFSFKEVMWTFSIYLEAIAIFPQLVLLQRTKNIDILTGQYVFLLGGHRVMYIVYWIFRYFNGLHYVEWLSRISGLVQMLMYIVLFYYYFQSWKNVKLQKEEESKTPATSLTSSLLPSLGNIAV